MSVSSADEDFYADNPSGPILKVIFAGRVRGGSSGALTTNELETAAKTS
jgi:hypothetical protein